jgi:hypothetical protein
MFEMYGNRVIGDILGGEVFRHRVEEVHNTITDLVIRQEDSQGVFWRGMWKRGQHDREHDPV